MKKNMGFFKKTMLGYSNMKDQQTQEHTYRCKNIPPPTAGLLSAFSSTGDIAPAQRSVLASTAVRHSGTEDVQPAKNGDLHNGADEGLSQSIAYGEIKALGCLDTKADTYGFELSESLGFESSVRMSGINLNDDSYRTVLEGLPPSSRPISRPRKVTSERIMKRNSIGSGLEDLPPFLSSMDEFGRPRYVLESVRNEGRLMLFLEKNKRRRGVVRRPSASVDGEMTTRLMLPYISDSEL